MPVRRKAGLRSGALLGIAALALHQLRYLAAHGANADNAIATQGHGYLEVLAPALGSLCMAVIAGQLLATAASRSPRAVPNRRPLGRTTFCVMSLLAIFCVQELAEGALSEGHAAGIDALLADRGWVALPIAIVLGALVSLAFSGVAKLERRIVGTLCPARERLPTALQDCYRGPLLSALPSFALMFGFSRRPPPLPAVH
jgi:hypothetical protein